MGPCVMDRNETSVCVYKTTAPVRHRCVYYQYDMCDVKVGYNGYMSEYETRWASGRLRVLWARLPGGSENQDGCRRSLTLFTLDPEG